MEKICIEMTSFQLPQLEKNEPFLKFREESFGNLAKSEGESYFLTKSVKVGKFYF